MDLVPIGEAARRLGVNASALRYYEERGLVHPMRRGGRRVYTTEELRRLAFIQLTHRLGLGLDTAAAVLDEPGEHWRTQAKEQIDALEELIALARGAQKFLTHAVNCPAEHPVGECPDMISSLDRLLAGVTFEELASEHA